MPVVFAHDAAIIRVRIEGELKSVQRSECCLHVRSSYPAYLIILIVFKAPAQVRHCLHTILERQRVQSEGMLHSKLTCDAVDRSSACPSLCHSASLHDPRRLKPDFTTNIIHSNLRTDQRHEQNTTPLSFQLLDVSCRHLADSNMFSGC